MATGAVIKGDFGDLDKLIERAGVMATSNFRQGVNRNLAQEAQSLIAEGFRQQRDPYGRSWKPSKRSFIDGGQTLAKTGRLRNAWAGRKALEKLGPDGFTITNRVKYAQIHQFGGVIRPKKPGGRLKFKVGGRFVYAKAVRIPRRPMIPFGPGLGPRWEPAFKRAATAYTMAVATGKVNVPR